MYIDCDQVNPFKAQVSEADFDPLASRQGTARGVENGTGNQMRGARGGGGGNGFVGTGQQDADAVLRLGMQFKVGVKTEVRWRWRGLSPLSSSWEQHDGYLALISSFVHRIRWCLLSLVRVLDLLYIQILPRTHNAFPHSADYGSQPIVPAAAAAVPVSLRSHSLSGKPEVVFSYDIQAVPLHNVFGESN